MTPRLPTDADVLAELKATFGYDQFRPLQREIVQASLNRRDVFAVLPTGGGKSLCYQLPALLRDGLTVVVSPLIALMQDQVDRLGAMGVAATYVNSSLERAAVAERLTRVRRGAVKLLYVAPERLMLPGFLDLLTSVRPACFAIDEAHCISEWGHDFRPEYRELRRLRALFPRTPLAAFTATATRRVQADIVAQLVLEQAATFRGSCNRPNLFYEVRPKRTAYEQLADYLRGRADQSGIIYCLSRAGTESLATRLQADGFSASAYHAGLGAEERRRRQEAFIRDRVRIVVATIAFGMGIDKPDVRFVVHYDLPKSLEGYYQESGRAGRDGEPSDCILFYGYGDAAKHEYFLNQKPTPAERETALRQLRRMVDWAAGTTCRRRALLAYFDERFDGHADRCCDVCREPVEVVDRTIPAQMFLSCARRTGERFSAAHLIAVLRGSQKRRVLRFEHHRLSTYGIGRDRSRAEWTELARELIVRGYARQDSDEFNALKVTERGRAVLFRGEKVSMPALRAASARAEAPATEPRRELFEELRALRKRLGDERGIPPYAVFPDATLRQMAAELPRERAHLLRIHGVGVRKLEGFGEAFLAAIAAFAARSGARTADGSPSAAGSASPMLSPSVRTTLDLFNQGHDPAAVATLRGLARSTVEGHLVAAVEAGVAIEIGRLVSADRQGAIEAAISLLGPLPLQPILEHLGDGYSYTELRLVRAALGWPARPIPAGVDSPVTQRR